MKLTGAMNYPLDIISRLSAAALDERVDSPSRIKPASADKRSHDEKQGDIKTPEASTGGEIRRSYLPEVLAPGPDNAARLRGLRKNIRETSLRVAKAPMQRANGSFDQIFVL